MQEKQNVNRFQEDRDNMLTLAVINGQPAFDYVLQKELSEDDSFMLYLLIHRLMLQMALHERIQFSDVVERLRIIDEAIDEAGQKDNSDFEVMMANPNYLNGRKVRDFYLAYLRKLVEAV